MIKENWKSADAGGVAAGEGGSGGGGGGGGGGAGSKGANNADANAKQQEEGGAESGAESGAAVVSKAAAAKELTEDERAVLALKDDIANDGVGGEDGAELVGPSSIAMGSSAPMLMQNRVPGEY